jgi:hypothetical protein
MSKSEPDDVPAPMLLSIQIVVATLLSGVLIFAAIAYVVRMRDPAKVATNPPRVSFMALGFAPIMLAVRAVLVPIVAKAGRKKLLSSTPVTVKQLMEQFSARTIMGSALLEDSAFFLLLAYLVEGQPWTLGGGLVMAGLIGVQQFPTRSRVEAALAADRQAIEDTKAAS